MNQAYIENEIIKIQPRGVITIPVKFRDKDFGADKFVRLKKVSGKIIIEPVTIPVYSVRRYTDDEVVEFLEEDRNESTI